MDSSDALTRVVQANPAIAVLLMVRFPLLPPGHARAQMDVSSTRALRRAMEFRTSLALPFWDAAMFAACEATEPTEGLFSAALFHNQPSSSVLLRTETLCADQIRHAFADSNEHVMAILSEVETYDRVKLHIPMIDFHCRESDTSRKQVETMLKAMSASGYLLASGKSYHFIGRELLTFAEMTRFLGRALLFGPIVDRTWVAHQLIEGRAALRVSSRPGYGGPPRVIGEVG